MNLTARRVRVAFDPAVGSPTDLAPAIRRSGYHTYVLDPAQETGGDPVLAELIQALGVAGFAAGNIMLFSVSVWSGANDATRDLFHWISAIIALPAIAYSGRIFFRSALARAAGGQDQYGRADLDRGASSPPRSACSRRSSPGQHAYFDASTSLLFFLLIGRTLDHLMRERARSAITGLARLQPRGATRVHADGRREYVRLDEIAPGMQLLELKAGERVPVDATVLSDGGDASTTRSSPARARRTRSRAAARWWPAPTTSAGRCCSRRPGPRPTLFLARMAAMMDAAENARTRPRRIADRAAAIYAPVVHTVALTTFLGWGMFSGDWHAALLNAVAVLIITCPCALALAVPIVHVVAAGRLFERGILMKDGAALERAAEVTSVAFDKTGTLTFGQPQVVPSATARCRGGARWPTPSPR